MPRPSKIVFGILLSLNYLIFFLIICFQSYYPKCFPFFQFEVGFLIIACLSVIRFSSVFFLSRYDFDATHFYFSISRDNAKDSQQVNCIFICIASRSTAFLVKQKRTLRQKSNLNLQTFVVRHSRIKIKWN